MGGKVPLLSFHIRAKEEHEDNDDWPTADRPDNPMLANLRRCTGIAITKDLHDPPHWDAFVAATTEKSRLAVMETIKGMKGLRNVLSLPRLNRNRNIDDGAVDAMAESLILSRGDIFMRLVVGTSGFSTFAYLTNALRRQNAWTESMPGLERSGYAPNYVVTDDCGKGRCFMAPPDVRMASISWHGKQYVTGSCGNVVEQASDAGFRDLGCSGLVSVTEPSDEL